MSSSRLLRGHSSAPCTSPSRVPRHYRSRGKHFPGTLRISRHGATRGTAGSVQTGYPIELMQLDPALATLHSLGGHTLSRSDTWTRFSPTPTGFHTRDPDGFFLEVIARG